MMTIRNQRCIKCREKYCIFAFKGFTMSTYFILLSLGPEMGHPEGWNDVEFKPKANYHPSRLYWDILKAIIAANLCRQVAQNCRKFAAFKSITQVFQRLHRRLWLAEAVLGVRLVLLWKCVLPLWVRLHFNYVPQWIFFMSNINHKI